MIHQNVIVENLLKREILRGKTPSAQYLFFNKNDVIHEFQSGFADIKNNRKADGSTTYPAYSVTKTFTALAVLQLAENGKLDIDESAHKYHPGFPYPQEITIRQLLTHTSGIPNPNPISWIHLPEEHGNFNRDQFFEGIFKRFHSLKSKPGEVFTYSNLNYVLLGQIIEKISGEKFEVCIRDHIIRPLGCSPAALGFEIADESLHAKGYQKYFSLLNLFLGLFIDKSRFMGRKEGKWQAFTTFYVNGISHGGLLGSPAAFRKYIQELLTPGCRLISDAGKKMLFTENMTGKNIPTGMCLSWFRGRLHGNDYFTHAGGGGGYYCEIRIYPVSGFGSVFFCNRTGIKDERFLDKLDTYYVKSQQ